MPRSNILKLIYFLRGTNEKLSLDCVPETQAESTEKLSDFVRWLGEDEQITLLPPAPFTSFKQYFQEQDRQHWPVRGMDFLV